MAAQIQLVDEGQTRRWTLHLGHGHRAVQRDDRTRRHLQQLVVEQHDLPPVGVGRGERVAVHGVDRGLELMARLVAAQTPAHEPCPSAISAASHSVRSWSASSTSAPSGPTRRPTRLHQQHEREEAGDLRLVGHQLLEQPAEPDRLGAEVLPDQPLARGRRVPSVKIR